MIERNLNNIKANAGKITISAYDAQSLEGYQIKGTAEYVTEGAVVDTFKAMVEKMFNGAATATDTNKFNSNFKKDHLQTIMEPTNSLKVIFYGKI